MDPIISRPGCPQHRGSAHSRAPWQGPMMGPTPPRRRPVPHMPRKPTGCWRGQFRGRRGASSFHWSATWSAI